MATIYIYNISSFDATKDQSVAFGYRGNQCIKNKLTVFNNETGAVVYENTVTTFNLSHLLPKGTLANGVSYKCKITAYFLDGGIEQSSESSMSNVFMCLTTPSWALNINDGAIVGNSYCVLKPIYSQAQNEKVNEYHLAVYTISGSEFWVSDTLYDITKEITVSGLSDNTSYYIRAYGTTVNGMVLDTRNKQTGIDTKINVDYISPTVYSLAYLENNKWQGNVRVTTNIASVEGRTGSGSAAKYINNTKVDLTHDSVIFDKNFRCGDNFVLEKIDSHIITNKPFLNLKGTNFEAIVTFRSGVFDLGEMFFAELKIKNSPYVLYSNMIPITAPGSSIHLWLQRKNGLYLLKITDMGVMA
ncbi:MAG: hypothetical protein RSB38_05230 [Oscillospiraceae bacterium]